MSGNAFRVCEPYDADEDIDPAELYEIYEDRAARAAATRYCPDCWRTGGHAIGCPGEESEGDDDEPDA